MGRGWGVWRVKEYIKTSNWSRWYFYAAGGEAFVLEPKDARKTMKYLFYYL